MSNAYFTTEARRAALSGTRQMIADDQFTALVALLVDCDVVPRCVMAHTLDRLANDLKAKAIGELQSEFQIYPPEIFDRARELSAQAAMLRRMS
ncbi:hypothetical protein [Bradyrhizobium sp. URHD0069]|uniref:hypothetical protein n=1 Tax=Bradyrhizobium sp. URHD0069 TaxID=1380355 RepID=UPI0004962AA3|nr:hypothetical protein [Bradyrhizobium sp. URHD0069]